MRGITKLQKEESGLISAEKMCTISKLNSELLGHL